MKKTFAEKVRSGEKTVLYELLPPPQQCVKEEITASVRLFSRLVDTHSVDAVNIPEVREETRNHNTPGEKRLCKLEPLVVCEALQQHGVPEVIINRPVVYLPWKQEKAWLQHAYKKNIRNFVLVGGESSAVIYPGISVTETAKYLTTTQKKDFADVCLGGILIPSRKNEAERLMSKTGVGITFFTTQVLYETEDIKTVLKAYWGLCTEKGIQAQMVFLSFAPVSCKKDIDLLLWLGVKIAETTVAHLKRGWLGMAERSIQLCEQFLQDILSFVKENTIGVPIGIHVEHINQHNFEVSFLLLERLKRIYL